MSDGDSAEALSVGLQRFQYFANLPVTGELMQLLRGNLKNFVCIKKILREIHMNYVSKNGAQAKWNFPYRQLSVWSGMMIF